MLGLFLNASNGIMMEKFEIEEKQGFDVIYVKKRNVEIQVVGTDKIPDSVPNDALIAYAHFPSQQMTNYRPLEKKCM